MAIFVGQIACLKTTGEDVFVLAISDGSKNDRGVEIVTVRRPVAGEQGLAHVTESFFVDELETKEERMQRHIESQKAFEKRLQEAVDESGVDKLGEPEILSN